MYDLHSGNPLDVKMALDALGAPKGEEGDAGGEKVLILISSLLAWDATPKKLIEVRDPREIQAEQQAELEEKEIRIQKEIKLIRDERQKAKEAAAAAEKLEEGAEKIEKDDKQDEEEDVTS